MKLEITKEKVLEAAKNSPLVKSVLETLFPDAFEDNTVFCKLGSVFTRYNYPGNVYCIIKHQGIVKIMNITHSTLWTSPNTRVVYVNSLRDSNAKTVTVSEFKRLVENHRFESFKIVKI